MDDCEIIVAEFSYGQVPCRSAGYKVIQDDNGDDHTLCYDHWMLRGTHDHSA